MVEELPLSRWYLLRQVQRDTKHYKVASRKSYSCQFCGHHVHPTARSSLCKGVSKADAHTNGIESFWSLVKNDLRGVNDSVSAKYLQTYLDEYSFRYLRRHDSTPMFESILKERKSHNGL